MKIVVIGGNGLIGKRLVSDLQDRGHEVVAASRSTGIDVLTGKGLQEAFQGADVVVDVTNSPSFAPDDVLKFFEISTGHMMKAAKAVGLPHFVALSIVGCDAIPDSGYMVAKVAQERLIRAAGVPFTIVRATQFFEFVEAIAESCRVGDELRMPTQLMQPIAADDVALALADAAVSAPTNGTFDIAGPEALSMADWGRRRFHGEPREQAIVDDATARYFGAALKHGSLVPQGIARQGAIDFDEWLGRNVAAH